MDKKFFVYTRVSDGSYEKSIDNQEEVIIKLAEKDWISKENLIIKSETKSSSKWSKREEFKEILSELEKDRKENWEKVDNRKYWWIYFFKIDRLARNDKDFQKVFNLLDAWYIFKSATETIENTPTWRLLFRMLSSFAIFESEKLWNRESIANIHNLVQKRFKSLWWKTIWFWYKTHWKNEIIKIEDKERDIILDIYEIFIQSKEWVINKLTYKDIFDEIDNKHWWYITKYLKEKSSASNKEKFIENILKNEKMFKYTWYIERSLNVNDELIKNYIDTIIDKKEDFYDIIWDPKVWGKVKFSFFFDNLVIVSDILNNQVKHHLNKGKRKDKITTKKIYNWLFEDIIFLEKNWKHYESKPYITNKESYQYRRTVDWKKYEIPEKSKIEDKIKWCWIIDKIQWLPEKKILEMKKACYEEYKKEKKPKLKKLIGTKNFYKSFIDRYDLLIEEESETKITNRYLKEKNKYVEYLKELNYEIETIKSEKNIYIERLIKLLSTKSVFSQDNYTKRDLFLSCFEKIIYNENKEITIILLDYLHFLWLPKKINI